MTSGIGPPGLPGQMGEADALVGRRDVRRAGADPGRPLPLGQVAERTDDPDPLPAALDHLGHHGHEASGPA